MQTLHSSYMTNCSVVIALPAGKIS